MKAYITVAVFGILMISCSAEKVNLSPFYESFAAAEFTPIQNYPEKFSDQSSQNFFASELVNQTSTFPHFKNSALEQEVGKLKYQVKQYVYALQETNDKGRSDALGQVEDSYKKIQKLRRFLNEDEDQIINRYLVRIKSNIGNIEALQPVNSDTQKQ